MQASQASPLASPSYPMHNPLFPPLAPSSSPNPVASPTAPFHHLDSITPSTIYPAQPAKRSLWDCAASVRNAAKNCFNSFSQGCRKVITHPATKAAVMVGSLAVTALNVGSGNLDPTGTYIDYANNGLTYGAMLTLGFSFQQLVTYFKPQKSSEGDTITSIHIPTPPSTTKSRLSRDSVEKEGVEMGQVVSPDSTKTTPTKSPQHLYDSPLKDHDEVIDKDSPHQIAAPHPDITTIDIDTTEPGLSPANQEAETPPSKCQTSAQKLAEYFASQIIYIQEKYAHPINAGSGVLYGMYPLIGMPFACITVGMFVSNKTDEIKTRILNRNTAQLAPEQRAITKKQLAFKIATEVMIATAGITSAICLTNKFGPGPYYPGFNDPSSSDPYSGSDNSTLAGYDNSTMSFDPYATFTNSSDNSNSTDWSDSSDDSSLPNQDFNFYMDPTVAYSFGLEYGVAAGARLGGYVLSKILNKATAKLEKNSHHTVAKATKFTHFILNTPALMVGTAYTLYGYTALTLNDYRFCLLGMAVAGLGDGFTVDQCENTPTHTYALAERATLHPRVQQLIKNTCGSKALTAVQFVKNNALTMATIAFTIDEATPGSFFGAYLLGSGLAGYYLRYGARKIIALKCDENSKLAKIQPVAKKFLVVGDHNHMLLISTAIWLNINAPGPNMFFPLGFALGISQDNALNETVLKTSATPGFADTSLVPIPV